MAVDKRRTGVDRGSPVNNESRSSRENTREILSTPVQPPAEAPQQGQATASETPDVRPSHARAKAVDGMAEWVREHASEVRGWPAVAGVDRRCLVAACDRSVFASLLCKTHYKHAVVTRRAAPKTSGQSPRGTE
jgi:hypothetical protein